MKKIIFSCTICVMIMVISTSNYQITNAEMGEREKRNGLSGLSLLSNQKQQANGDQYRVINNLSGRCLDTFFGEVDDTTNVTQMGCDWGLA